MKEQYVGDVNDYRKYALLRALGGNGETAVGVCWMLTPPDNRSDGCKDQYLDQREKWGHYDPDVFGVLRESRRISCGDRQRLTHIEESGILQNTKYFNDILHDHHEHRRGFFSRMHAHFHDVDLVFFDPDNGMEVDSKPKGRRGSSKYLFRDEIESTFTRERSVLIYQHFPRIERNSYIEQSKQRLARIVPKESIHAFVTPHVVFLLLIHPQHSDKLSYAVEAIKKKSAWSEKFLTVR